MDGMSGERRRGASSLQLVMSTSVPLHMRSKLREIINLHTDEAHRGKRYASALMDDVCAEADNKGFVLMLTADPFGVGRTKEQLIDWYKRMSFVQIQTEPVVMARQPHTNG